MTWNWNCDHDTPFHHRLLHETAHGALRHCPRCGAHPRKMPGGWLDWGEPRESWREANRPPGVDSGILHDLAHKKCTDWSEPRPIPWLPWDHPNYFVTSEREALKVCRDWGIDPSRPGGFISEAHRERAIAAGQRNRRAAVAALSPRERAQRRAVRAGKG